MVFRLHAAALAGLTAVVFMGPAAHAQYEQAPYKLGVFAQEDSKVYTEAADGGSLDGIERIALVDGTVVAVGDEGSFRFDGSEFVPSEVEVPEAEELEAEDVEDNVGRVWRGSRSKAVARDSEGHLWFGIDAGVARQTSERWEFEEGKDGLPYTHFTCAAAGDDGSVWFGTKRGLVRWRNGEWQYRQGPRWLAGDTVRAIAPDGNGGAWIATEEGISHIFFVPMTLRQKADFYEKQMEYFRRTPYGYVSLIAVKQPGDLASEIKQPDSDNDGLWTGMYGAGEAFGYGATQNPVIKARAKQAFEAMRFLQKVTQGCEHAPPKGFVARTIRSVEDKDPNIGRVERDREAAKNDALWKVYENRWPLSADGKWYWKSDTSSDELDGHYFFYPAYYDYCADTEEEKERVREVVRDLTDHLIEHNYQLVDHDGKPTRWGVYDPDNLNQTQEWWSERGIRSLSILSYLFVTAHITGDERYLAEADKLIRDHAYLANLMSAKNQWSLGSGNQSDDEMAIMSYYNLVKYCPRPELLNQMGYGFFQYYAHEQPERNPFFNFAYASFGLGADYHTVWGVFPIAPHKRWLEDSMETLMGFSLDQFNWSMENSHRLDVVMLPWQGQRKDLYQPASHKRGHLVDGRVLPVENRHFFHWNTDPWELDYKGSGKALANGTIFLLPYYMGLYHGFIEEAG